LVLAHEAARGGANTRVRALAHVRLAGRDPGSPAGKRRRKA
jgi:hypothetical protein